MAILDELQNRARQIGIPKLGISPLPPNQPTDFLQHWIKQGFMAGMDYLERSIKKRAFLDPVLPNQKSAIVCLFPYPEVLYSSHISAYALFPDYHIHVMEFLHKLEMIVLQLLPSAKTLPFADTLPIMEKLLAKAAGLGFQGKNTLLLSPDFGSYHFIGGILTDQVLPATGEIKDEVCGDCKRCQEACPTGALTDNGLDARRCLSYHTIENKGEIPPELGQAMGRCVFGCGLCETVCPKNNNRQFWTYPDWKGDKTLAQKGLEELLEMCDAGFARNFRNTPIFRLGKTRFKRNILLAMKNRNTQYKDTQ